MSEPKKYRKKPVEIEAWHLTEEHGSDVAKWCGGSWHPTTKPGYTSNLFINTLEGRMQANIGDYIIKGVNGEFYPCKPDIFEKTYAALDAAEAASHPETTDSSEQVCECGHSEVWHMQACNYPTHGDECKCGCREFRPAKEQA